MRLDLGGCGDHRTVLTAVEVSLRHTGDLNGLDELERTFNPEGLFQLPEDLEELGEWSED